MADPADHARIALLLDLGSSYGRGLLRGVGDMTAPRRRYRFLVNPDNSDAVLAEIEQADCHGVIAQVTRDDQADVLRRLPVPVINTADNQYADVFPSVTADNHDIGRVAAGHLLDCQLRHFAFVPRLRTTGADQRRHDGFAARLAAEGFDPRVYAPPAPPHDQPLDRMRHLSRWLAELPKPVGVFASGDPRGRDVLDAAARAAIDVPNAVAVVAAGSDHLLSHITYPPLSSVHVPARKIGYEAMGLLMRLIDGEPPPAEPIRLPVLNVDARLSSDLTAIADEDVATVVRFIRDNASRNIQVTDLIDAVAISRRSLERRFQAALGRSPQQEIQRVRIEIAQRLLAETDLPVPRVARQAGFSSADRLAAVFRQHLGMTPTDFRRRFQPG